VGRDQALLLLGWVVLLALAESWRGNGSREGTSDRRLVTNFGLTAMVLAAGALFPIARVSASAASQSLPIGVIHSAQWPWIAAFASVLIVETLAAYWAHRITHRTPLLWRLHRVHHADDAVDLSTSFRNHPLELVVTIPVSVAVVLVLGTPPSVVIAMQTVLAGAALWQHADLALPRRLDRALAWVVVTPRVHRLHHNPARATHDSNYGEFFTFWDRVFGTFNPAEGRDRVGLDNQVAMSDALLQQIWSPVHRV